MTADETIKDLKDENECCYRECEGACSEVKNGVCNCREVILVSIIEKYRSIGTVEECREAVGKQKPKIPDIWGDGYDDNGNMIYDSYACPNCGENYEIDCDHYEYCPKCGQHMDKSSKVFE